MGKLNIAPLTLFFVFTISCHVSIDPLLCPETNRGFFWVDRQNISGLFSLFTVHLVTQQLLNIVLFFVDSH